MVIVFATVVFTGSIIKGARDRVGGFFAKSISTDQESSSNKRAASAEPHDSIIKTSNYKRKLPRPLSITPENTTNTRCFQSYSSNDLFNCPEEILVVKDQGDKNKEVNMLKKSKKVRNETTTSATVGADHTMNETGRTREKGLGLGVAEDQETVEMSMKNDVKLKIVSFQTCSSMRSPMRHRRKRPKTLKKEFEEAGMLIHADGQTQSTAEPLEDSAPQDQCDKSKTEGQCGNFQLTRITEEEPEESSSQDQSNEVNMDSQCDIVKQDKPDEINTLQSEVIAAVEDNSGDLQISMDDTCISITKDEASGSKHHEKDEYNCTTKRGPDGEVFSTEDTTAFKPVMVSELLEKEKSQFSKTQSKRNSTGNGNKNVLYVSEEEKDGSSKDTSSDSNIALANKPRLHQVPVCSHDGLPNVGDLSEPERPDTPLVNVGDTVQNQTKNENHQSQGIISETGDYGKPAETNHKEVSAIKVDSGGITRIKHRSQKGIEDNLSLHRGIQKDSSTPLKESVKVDTTKIAEGNPQSSKESSKDELQPSAAQQVQTVKTKTSGRDAVANNTSSAVQTSSNHFQVLENLLNESARIADVPDRLDQAVARFDWGDVELDSTQRCIELSEEPGPRYGQEIMPSEKSDIGKHIEQFPGSVPNKYRDCFLSTESFTCSRKDDDKAQLDRIKCCSDDSSMPSHQIFTKKELHGFLEDFSAVDGVRAYWSLDAVHKINPRPCQCRDAIVMAVENRDQQQRRMEGSQLRERISKATEELAAITKETKRKEVRLIKLAREVGKARSASEKSEKELHDDRKVYRASLLRCCKIEEDAKTLDSRSRAVERELQSLKRREWKTGIMLKAARGEIKLLDHRITKEQILQEEQRDKRLSVKRRRFQRTSLKVNTLAALIILQILLLIIIALWRI